LESGAIGIERQAFKCVKPPGEVLPDPFRHFELVAPADAVKRAMTAAQAILDSMPLGGEIERTKGGLIDGCD
jgi:hypothetical protein